MAEQGVANWIQACVALLLCVTGVLPASTETSRNYYDILNVEPTATDSQIKRNFRKLAVKYHPDKNKSTDAERAFAEIAEGNKNDIYVFIFVSQVNRHSPGIKKCILFIGIFPFANTN